MHFQTDFKYFSTTPTTTIEDIKIQFRNLAIKHHPDMGGDTATMAAINAEFDALCKRYNGVHRASDGSVYANPDKPDIVGPEFRAIIDALLRNCGPNVHIEIIGTFVWVSGDTRPYAKLFKELGMRWDGDKKMWFKCPHGYVRKGRKAKSIQAIRNIYGVSFDAYGMQKDDALVH